MALIAALEFGDNNIGRYSKSYLATVQKVWHVVKDWKWMSWLQVRTI